MGQYAASYIDAARAPRESGIDLACEDPVRYTEAVQQPRLQLRGQV